MKIQKTKNNEISIRLHFDILSFTNEINNRHNVCNKVLSNIDTQLLSINVLLIFVDIESNLQH